MKQIKTTMGGRGRVLYFAPYVPSRELSGSYEQDEAMDEYEPESTVENSKSVLVDADSLVRHNTPP